MRHITISLTILALIPFSAVAQEELQPESSDSTPPPAETVDDTEYLQVLEELVIIGSRAEPRSVTDSAVPVDTFGGESLTMQGATDLQDLLRTIIPSFNVNTQPISDSSTVVRPLNIRGLPPDHTLLLINGKRRHRASVIHWLGNGVADGAQGPDVAPIPALAVKRLEVLRDGASAQYGSDAIAGVLNFELNDSYEGGSLVVRTGIYQEGDGEAVSIAGNIGLGSEKAWINLTGEYGNSGETIRSVQRDDAAALIAVGNTEVANPAQIWGQPFVRDDLKLFAAYGGAIGGNLEFYGHANYASKEVEGGFYYRNPNTRRGVFSNDGGKTLLVGALDGDESKVPVVTITNHVPDPVALQQVFDDPNLFTFQELFPGGFTPRFGAFTNDRSIVAGVRTSRSRLGHPRHGSTEGHADEGTSGSKLGLDFSVAYGRHHADFFIFNTVNASLGPDTPTSFDPGDYIQTDINLNFGATYALSEQLFLASGLEYRVEEFEIVRGDPESYEIGQPLAQQGFTGASNGFSGFGDITAGIWDRSNYAVYVDAEYELTEDWLVAAALRYENFSDFGGTTNYKLATTYGVNENLKVRGSFNTGFRAPTPGQQNAFNVTTEFQADRMDLITRGVVPSTNPAAMLRGGEALTPEKSTNFSIGFIADLGNAVVTVDYFGINVKDRMSLSQDFVLTDAEREQLIAAGITSAANLVEYVFFINDFDTETRGIDVVVSAGVRAGELSLGYNYTDTEVTQFDPDTIDDVRIRELQEGLPKHRATITLTQPLGNRWNLLGRGRYYSSWFDSEDSLTYGDEFLVDLEVNYSLTERITVSAGGQNVFNNYPDENPTAAATTGNQYGQFCPFGFDGAFWYGRLSYSF